MSLSKDLKLLVYKNGVSNEAVKRYFNQYKIDYDSIISRDEYDYIIKPPGIRMDEIKIKGKIICDIELAYMINPFFSIGITSTNGKTTCVLLIKHLLEQTYKINMCGNIGIPIFDVLADERKIYLIELSSFELESVINYKPRIAVMLNIEEAHLDHHDTMENYISSKANLTKNQDRNDFLIYNYDDLNVRKIAQKSNAIKISLSLYDKNANVYCSNDMIYSKYGNVSIKNNFSRLEGDLYNTMAAVMVGLLSDISINIIERKLETFKKPSFRMEEIYPNIYNDSKSTNIFSTLTQIKEMKEVSLICGGYDRLNSLDKLENVSKHVKTFYLYGANRNRVAAFLKDKNIKYMLFSTLEDAVIAALHDYKIILFSPMAPSYDEFNSFEERGKKFNEIIKKYLPKVDIK